MCVRASVCVCVRARSFMRSLCCACALFCVFVRPHCSHCPLCMRGVCVLLQFTDAVRLNTDAGMQSTVQEAPLCALSALLEASNHRLAWVVPPELEAQVAPLYERLGHLYPGLEDPNAFVSEPREEYNVFQAQPLTAMLKNFSSNADLFSYIEGPTYDGLSTDPRHHTAHRIYGAISFDVPGRPSQNTHPDQLEYTIMLNATLVPSTVSSFLLPQAHAVAADQFQYFSIKFRAVNASGPSSVASFVPLQVAVDRAFINYHVQDAPPSLESSVRQALMSIGACRTGQDVTTAVDAYLDATGGTANLSFLLRAEQYAPQFVTMFVRAVCEPCRAVVVRLFTHARPPPPNLALHSRFPCKPSKRCTI